MQINNYNFVQNKIMEVKMQTENIYEEKIFSKWITVILVSITVGLLFVLVYQILVEPIGTRPAPIWFLLIMFLLFLGVTINFSRMIIRMTHRSLLVGYGIFKRTIPWENIEDCYPDESSVIRYGGWGIRVGRVKGKWILVYNTIGNPRVMLLLKKGRFKEFVFSTKNPEEVMKVVRQQVDGIK